MLLVLLGGVYCILIACHDFASRIVRTIILRVVEIPTRTSLGSGNQANYAIWNPRSHSEVGSCIPSSAHLAEHVRDSGRSVPIWPKVASACLQPHTRLLCSKLDPSSKHASRLELLSTSSTTIAVIPCLQDPLTLCEYDIIVSTMPGPRAKQNSGKKNKHKAESQGNPALGSTSSPTVPISVLNALDELSNDDWGKIAKVLCDHFKLPGMSTTSF